MPDEETNEEALLYVLFEASEEEVASAATEFQSFPSVEPRDAKETLQNDNETPNVVHL